QPTNAKALAEGGGVKVMSQTDATADALRDTLQSLMNDPERLAAMASAARSTANPDAARLLADKCEAIASPTSHA
ncbi:MAG: glycosyltransferase, partial [Pseudomonadota bacterium]